DIRKVKETTYISTGGGGGILDSQKKDKSYHYIEIRVNNGELTVSIEKPIITAHSEGITFLGFLWNKIYSWVYVNFINVLLIISISFLIVYLFYIKLIERIDYYPDVIDSVKKDYPLTIAMFTNNYLPFIGGVPLSISRLKKGLEKKGHQVYVFAPDYTDGSEKLQEKGVIRFSPLFHYKKGELIVPVSNIFSSKIRNEFKKINPDIVHVHHPFWLGTVGKRLAKKYKKPIVFTYHTRLEQYNHYVPVFQNLAGGQIPHMLIKFFASTCDAVIAPTKSAKRYLRNLGIGKLIVIQPTGIDLSSFQKTEKTDQNKLILFSVFRLSKEKSPYFLLEGIEKLSQQCAVPFQCLIAGTGPEEENMANYIKNHDLDKYVLLLGKIPPEKISDYYSKSDIFIFSSQSETQGMVILEAMAGGSPVVAVDSSGISDIVINGKNGFKTDADLNQWVGKIQFLLEKQDQREILGNQARLTGEMNSIESMSDNILDMYYEIIDWKKKHPNKVFIR
ncbi:MAG: glycosyltransferase, partial [Spirochaetaceae bacterium]|nr:glycosyltransferase [Spirochaetaceae bacterium]